MRAIDLGRCSDDELFAPIERLDQPGHDRGGLAAAVQELFRRLRAEAAPDGLPYIEVAIAHLRRTFSQSDDDDGPELDGVREPRRLPPGIDTSTVRLAS